MTTYKIEPPSPFAPKQQQDAYVDRLRETLTAEPGNNFIRMALNIYDRPRRSRADAILDYDPDQPRAPKGDPKGGQWVSAGGSSSGEGEGERKVANSVKGTLTPEQLAALQAAANGGSMDEVLEAMKPVYAANAEADAGSTLTLVDGKIPDGFFEGRKYNLPDGSQTDITGAIRHLMEEGEKLAGPGGPGNGAQAIMLIGPPAAGKSTIANELAGHGYAIVDADEAKKMIPGYDNGRGSGVVHEESSAISKMVQHAFAQKKTNVIIQTVSSGPSSAIAKVDALHREGYRVDLVGMEISPDVAAQRMARRYIRTGRYVPKDVVQNAPRISMEVYEVLKEHTDGYAKVNSSRDGSPTTIESTVNWIAAGAPLVGRSRD